MRKTILPALLLLMTTACGPPQSMFHPRGAAANNISTIGWAVFITLGVIAFVMWVLLAWASIRRRGSLLEHEPYDKGGGQNWVFIGGLAIPFVVLCGLFVFGLERLTDFPVNDGDINPQIRIVGHQFWWEVQYLDGPVDQHFTTANEIHIPVGKPVDLLLESADVIHSFWVPSLHGKMQLIPGQPNYLRIEADQPGEFPGQCAQYCGEQHAHMRILVVAQTPEQYALWRQNELKPAVEPQDAEAKHGQQVFDDGPCALCHTVRGTPAGGKVAPDLTHLAGRKYIGANSFLNDTADLGGWITHAQSMKPGCEMPNLTFFDGRDLRALIAYLQELK
jgi:cytochrome c oxidase subunit II